MSEWKENLKDPFAVFTEWYSLALKNNSFEPTAMTLATLDNQGMPSARVVLLKHFEESGFCFFTNYESAKAKEIEAHPNVALNFHWQKPLHRQVRVRGVVEKMSYEESDAYFQTRERGSQIGAWASPQSHKISDRDELMERIKNIEEKFANKNIPCPAFWGGYRVKPLSFEFWQAEVHRLHERLKFTRDDLSSPWKITRLAP